MESRGPNTDPWGTRRMRSALEEKQSPSLTLYHHGNPWKQFHNIKQPLGTMIQEICHREVVHCDLDFELIFCTLCPINGSQLEFLLPTTPLSLLALGLCHLTVRYPSKCTSVAWPLPLPWPNFQDTVSKTWKTWHRLTCSHHSKTASYVILPFGGGTSAMMMYSAHVTF